MDNNDGSRLVDLLPQQESQSQLHYDKNKETGYCGHDPPNAQTIGATTVISTPTSCPSISQAHSHNRVLTSELMLNVSPYHPAQAIPLDHSQIDYGHPRICYSELNNCGGSGPSTSSHHSTCSGNTPHSQSTQLPSLFHLSEEPYLGPNNMLSQQGYDHHTAFPSINSSNSNFVCEIDNASMAIPASALPNALIQNLEEDAMRAAAEGEHLAKIIEHSQIIQTFADRCAWKSSNSTPFLMMPTTDPESIMTGPTCPEYAEMAKRAAIVLELVIQLAKEAGVAFNPPELSSSTTANNAVSAGATVISEMFGKKEGWEDDEVVNVLEELAYFIRSKHARSMGNTGTGMPGRSAKSKLKRRGAHPLGECPSCNTRETPEWRRGPDGERTLCNACGLRYAKLKKKWTRSRGSMHLAPISIEMLRASKANLAKDLTNTAERGNFVDNVQ